MIGHPVRTLMTSLGFAALLALPWGTTAVAAPTVPPAGAATTGNLPVVVTCLHGSDNGFKAHLSTAAQSVPIDPGFKPAIKWAGVDPHFKVSLPRCSQ
jgi:hypothetical protein